MLRQLRACLVFVGIVFSFSVLGASTAQANVNVGDTIQLNASNYGDRFVRHRNYLGELTPVSSDLDKKDSSFIVRPGLAGQGISFESVNLPGFYLRHQGFQIKLQKLEGSDLYKKDASFHVRSGAAGKGASFESVNFPGFYLRHCSFKLFIDNNKHGNKACDTKEDVFKADVTYKVVTVASAAAAKKGGAKFSGWYRLKTQFRGKDECLEGNQSSSNVKGGAAFMDRCQNVSGQLWKIEDAGNGFYRLKTQFRGENECLEGNQSSSNVKAGAAFMDKCQNVTGQLWKIEDAGNGFFRLKTQFRGEGECFEGNQSSSQVKGGAAFMDKCQNVSGQLWQLVQ